MLRRSQHRVCCVLIATLPSREGIERTQGTHSPEHRRRDASGPAETLF